MKTVKSTFRFRGGVHPDYNKDLARGKAIERMPVPAELVISMSQHLGAPAKCIVKAGDYVRRGQLIGEKNGFISVPVYASANGLVKAIEPRLGPAGGKAPAVILDTTAPAPESGEAVSSPLQEMTLPPLDWKTATKEELLARVARAVRRHRAFLDSRRARNLLRLGRVTVDLEALELADGAGRLVRLTRTEADILRLLDEAGGELVTANDLIDATRGEGFVCDENTVYVHLANLRRKLGPARDLLVTERGAGYRLMR